MHNYTTGKIKTITSERSLLFLKSLLTDESNEMLVGNNDAMAGVELL